MAKSTSLNFPQNVKNGGATFGMGDGETIKTIITAGANDTRVVSLNGTMTPDVDMPIGVILSDGTNNYILASILVASGAGSSGIASADLLNSTNLPGLPIDANGKRFIALKAGWSLKCFREGGGTSAAVTTITAIAEDY